jgi:hypothetical protein
MNREKVISREYKLVLKSENFNGSEYDVIGKATTFWAGFTNITKPIIKTFIGDFNAVSTKREIRFYDTKDFILNNNSYIFRERRDLLDDQKEVTLKFRHPDRYVSQDRDMLSRKIGNGETKFEEDIKAPFLKLYSFSSTQQIEDGQEYKNVKQVFKLYPGLKSRLRKNAEDEKMILVNDLVIREVVITGSEMMLCNDPLVKAECALIVWYDSKLPSGNPLIVEFSFRYGNKKEKYDGRTALNGYEIFMAIQEKMKTWIEEKDKTKTGFIYQHR